MRNLDLPSGIGAHGLGEVGIEFRNMIQVQDNLNLIPMSDVGQLPGVHKFFLPTSILGVEFR